MHVSTLRLHRATVAPRAMRFALMALAALGLAVFVFQVSSNHDANAAGGLRYQRGYSVQGSWLCYGWANGVYHCTHHWHRTAGGKLVSDNPRWVPNNGSSAVATVTHHAAPAAVKADPPAPRQAAPARPVNAAPVNTGQGGIAGEIQAVFGPYAGQALNVARCESGFNPSAVNRSSDAEGVFQFLASTWAGTPYAGYSRMNASANIHAAYYIFQKDGYSWREWQCKP